MEYLVRFVQMHETFRQPEIDALADLEGLEIDWVSYSEDVRATAAVERREQKLHPACLIRKRGL